MKVYIVQENFSYTGEDSFGEDELEVRRYIKGVCLTTDEVVRTIAKAVVADCSEYYMVGIDDYRVLEAELTDGGDRFDNTRYVNLTDEQKAECARLIDIEEKKWNNRYKKEE